MATDAPELLSGRTLGEFQLIELLDEGGFGAVYLARQSGLARPVVVKVLHRTPPPAGASLPRFVREAQLAARVDHPYATQVYALGVEDDGDDALLWIAMEWVQGVSLADWLDKNGRMPLERFVPFFERVAQVVEAAHERGIVHRDLKPSNVMVIERSGELLPKLLDFGIAKLLDEVDAPAAPPTDRPIDDGLTPASAVIGTLPYIAPELWGDPANARPASDVYALGVIAFEALTGQRPFRGTTALELASQHCLGEVPSAGTLDPIFARVLAKRPEHRYTSALELAAALRAELDARLVAQIRAAAKVWHGRGRARSLLWRDEPLAEIDRWLERTSTTPPAPLTTVELEFIDASRTSELDFAKARARGAARARRLGIMASAIAVAIVFGAFQFRAAYETRFAQQRAEDAEHEAAATALTAEVEQGRAALLHDDLVEAQRHLGEAWRGGDRSASTAFMYARALQPLRAELARLPASAGRMWSAGWSPDGRWIATSDDHGAQVWDATTYAQLSPLPHSDVVYSAVWAGPERLVTACGDGSVRIWDAARGELVRELRLHGRAPRWYVVAATADGRRVAAVDTKGTVAAVWDAVSGAVLSEPMLRGANWPSVAFSADGRWLAAGGGAAVKVLDTWTWRLAAQLGEQVRAIAWDPTGPRLLAGEATGEASIWGIPLAVRQPPHRIGEVVTAVAFSPDGTRAAVAGEDGAERVLDVATGRILAQGNHLRARVASIVFDAGGERVATAASGEISIGDAANGLPVDVIEGPKQQLRGAWFDAGGGRVLAASWDGTARVWNAIPSYRRWSAGPLSRTYGLFGGAEPDGRYMAIACDGCATRVWDTARDRLLAELPAVTPAADDVPVPFPVVSAAGDRAAIARGGAVDVYELPGGRLVRSIEHGAVVTALAFGPAGELVGGSLDGEVLVTRGEDSIALAAASATAGIAALAPLQGGRIAVADTAGRVRILAGSGAATAAFNTSGRARMLRASPDGGRVLVVPFHADRAAPMALIDLAAGAMVQLDGPPVYAARWVDAGRAILSAHADGSARLWSSSSGVLLHTYIGGARYLADADLSPDGRMVIGGSGDGVLRFWDTATAQPLWVVEAHKPSVMGVHFQDGDLVTRGIGGEVTRWSFPDPSAVISGVAPASR